MKHAIELTTTTERNRAFAGAPRVPPIEMQLWNPGDNPTDYGVHRWTDRSVAAVFGLYDARRNPLLIDVEHNGAKTEGDEPTVIGGYARLELRAGAPWLVFDWSSYAIEQITTGQRRFLSPEYDIDLKTGEIVALFRVSLVADPGTWGARMLAGRLAIAASAARPQRATHQRWCSGIDAIEATAVNAELPEEARAAMRRLLATYASGSAGTTELQRVAASALGRVETTMEVRKLLGITMRGRSDAMSAENASRIMRARRGGR